jgi:hypothetical protein
MVRNPISRYCPYNLFSSILSLVDFFLKATATHRIRVSCERFRTKIKPVCYGNRAFLEILSEGQDLTGELCLYFVEIVRIKKRSKCSR